MFCFGKWDHHHPVTLDGRCTKCYVARLLCEKVQEKKNQRRKEGFVPKKKVSSAFMAGCHQKFIMIVVSSSR